MALLLFVIFFNDSLFTSATFASTVRTSTVFTVSSFATFAIAGTLGIFHDFLLIKY